MKRHICVKPSILKLLIQSRNKNKIIESQGKKVNEIEICIRTYEIKEPQFSRKKARMPISFSTEVEELAKELGK